MKLVDRYIMAQAFKLMAELAVTLKAQGHNIRHLDLGGEIGRAHV